MKSSTRTIGIAAASIAALLSLAACGGSLDAAAAPTAAASTITASSTAPGVGGGDGEAFANRMKEHDVDFGTGWGGPGGPNGAPPSGMPAPGASGMPAPGASGMPGGPGGDNPEFQKAIEACKDLAPAGFGQRPSMDANALKAFTTCMSDNGVTITEGQDPFAGVDRNDPATKTALDTCGSLLPMGPGGPGGQGAPASAPAQWERTRPLVPGL